MEFDIQNDGDGWALAIHGDNFTMVCHAMSNDDLASLCECIERARRSEDDEGQD